MVGRLVCISLQGRLRLVYRIEVALLLHANTAGVKYPRAEREVGREMRTRIASKQDSAAFTTCCEFTTFQHSFPLKMRAFHRLLYMPVIHTYRDVRAVLCLLPPFPLTSPSFSVFRTVASMPKGELGQRKKDTHHIHCGPLSQYRIDSIRGCVLDHSRAFACSRSAAAVSCSGHLNRR